MIIKHGNGKSWWVMWDTLLIIEKKKKNCSFGHVTAYQGKLGKANQWNSIASF